MRYRKYSYLLFTIVIGFSLLRGAYASDFEPSRIVPKALEGIVSAFVVDGDKIVAVGERGHIFRASTQDHNFQQSSSPVRQYLTAVDGAEGKFWAVGHDSIILHTEDGGDSWDVQYYDPDFEAPLLDICYHSPNSILAVGAYGRALLTKDKGKNWEELILDEEEPHFYAVKKDGEGNYYLAGEFGTLLKVDKEGKLLQRFNTEVENTFFGVEPLEEKAFVVYGLRGLLYYSKDGTNYEKIETPTTAALYGSKRLDDKILFWGSQGVYLQLNIKKKEVISQSLKERIDITQMEKINKGMLLTTSKGFRYIN